MEDSGENDHKCLRRVHRHKHGPIWDRQMLGEKWNSCVGQHMLQYATQTRSTGELFLTTPEENREKNPTSTPPAGPKLEPKFVTDATRRNDTIIPVRWHVELGPRQPLLHFPRQSMDDLYPGVSIIFHFDNGIKVYT